MHLYKIFSSLIIIYALLCIGSIYPRGELKESVENLLTSTANSKKASSISVKLTSLDYTCKLPLKLEADLGAAGEGVNGDLDVPAERPVIKGLPSL